MDCFLSFHFSMTIVTSSITEDEEALLFVATREAITIRISKAEIIQLVAFEGTTVAAEAAAAAVVVVTCANPIADLIVAVS